jgi:hypothetical protein
LRVFRPEKPALAAKASRPSVGRIDRQVRLARRIVRQCGADGVFRLGLNDLHHAVLVGQRPRPGRQARMHRSVRERRGRARRVGVGVRWLLRRFGEPPRFRRRDVAAKFAAQRQQRAA